MTSSILRRLAAVETRISAEEWAIFLRRVASTVPPDRRSAVLEELRTVRQGDEEAAFDLAWGYLTDEERRALIAEIEADLAAAGMKL